MRAREPLLSHARYVPGEVLGAGAQGVVIRVTDREAEDRALVAKVYRAGAFREESLVGEYALLARLRVPGVVRAHDFGADERTGAPFFVEEHVGGPHAAEWVAAAAREERTLRLARIVSDVARALAALHAAGFVHGDLKPAHVRMRGEEAVLLDLGAAVSTTRAKAIAGVNANDGVGGAIAFTSAFAAPEVLAGGGPSAASDLYGLGALAWAIATGRPPEPRAKRRSLFDEATWVEPRVAGVVDALVALHPRDRPADAREVLARIGTAAAGAGIALGAPPAPIGREREIAALAKPSPGGVRYVIGPSGAGKSHLARELGTRARLAGSAVREVTFPCEADALLPALVAFLRGHGQWPFATAEEAGRALLLILDGLDSAPAEVAAALDAYRCRPVRSPSIDVLATARAAPSGADAIVIGKLEQAAFEALCGAMGVSEEAEVARLRSASEGMPGWLVAELGRVPLTKDTAIERAKALSAAARAALAAIAIAGGTLSDGVLRRGFGASESAIAELYAKSLVTRRSDGDSTQHELCAPAIAADLASAIGTREIAGRVADALIDDVNASVAALLTVASAEATEARPSSERRTTLLERAAERARSLGLRAEETRALVALCRDASERTAARVVRLERLLRDAGMGAGYPEVLGWLEEIEGDDRVRVLALRRRAEKAARDGDAEGARARAEEAIAIADRIGDRAVRAFARATAGLVALMHAAWGPADAHLAEAREMLGDAGDTGVASEAGTNDPEEVARMEHNAGVVALYRSRADEAVDTFERALATKRRLGDRAGMRSCLMNLGIALGKAGRDREAREALDEAMSLARSLGQTAGLGWCLSALADIEVRKRDGRAAERWIAEAQALSAALPAAIRADLVLSRAHVALLDGDGERAKEALAGVDDEVRTSDPLVDARTLAAQARAHLATLPPEPRLAARLAVRAVRRARAAQIADVEAEALATLRAVRPRATPQRIGVRYPDTVVARANGEDDALWAFVAGLPRASDEAATLADLARALVARAGAERAFVADLGNAGEVRAAWGADVEGFGISDAAKRIGADVVDRASRKSGPVYERDLVSTAGRGSRLCARHEGASGAALVVVEHRFRPAAFDHVSAAEIDRWAALAALALRLFREDADTGGVAVRREERGATPDVWSADSRRLESTVMPLAEPRRSFPSIVGESLALRRALARLDAAIDSDLPVLISGETGTGKELFARALHEHGPRRRREIVSVNCGGVPDSLFEAELFGHARGSFTGAERARPGLLARAEGGTLFLDEIGELPLTRQAVLLRALSTSRYRAVGSDEERPFDVRLVAATNRDLERAAQDGAFRQDLLYRVNAIAIHVPPLRARDGDVPLLVRGFLGRAATPIEIEQRAMEALAAYAWPGNVRELLHVVERLAALGARRIGIEHLPRVVRAALTGHAGFGDVGASDARAGRSGASVSVPVSAPASAGGRSRGDVDEQHRAEIDEAMRATSGNISHAAQRLGLTRHGLKKRMARLGITNAWKRAI